MNPASLAYNVQYNIVGQCWMLHYDAYWVSASHRNVARATKQILDLLQVTTLYFSHKANRVLS